MLKVKKISLFFIYIYAFFIIYSPNIFKSIGIESYYLLAVLAFFQLAVYILKRKKIVNLLTKNGLVFACSIFMLSICYIIIALINGADLLDFNRLRIIQNNMPIICLINVAFLVHYLKKLNYDSEKMLCFVFNVVLIQSIICVLMLIIPQFRNIALYLYDNDNIFITSVRIYGISSDYTYATPIFHGVISSIMTIYAILKNKRKYFLYIPFFAIAIFFNGRTGLLIYIFTILVCLLIIGIKKKKIFSIIKFLTIGIVCSIVLINILSYVAPNSYWFVKSFVEDTVNLIFQRELTGNYVALFDSFVFFPEGIKLLIGYSTQVIGTKGYAYGIYKSSDIGYINDIFLGGIIYATSLYTIYLNFIKKKISRTNSNYFMFNLFSIILILSLIIANYKGEIFRSTIMVTCIFLIKLIFINDMECDKNE